MYVIGAVQKSTEGRSYRRPAAPTRVTFLRTGQSGTPSLLETDLEEALPNRYYRLSVTKIREASSYIGLVLPLLISVYYAWVRNQRRFLEQLRRSLLSTVVAVVSRRISFNVVSVGKVFHVSATKIDFLLRVIKPSTEADRKDVPEKSVHCEVLHDPGPDAREADVIFVHGIKGALEKTWTQGLWSLGQFCVRSGEHGQDEGHESQAQEEYSKCWPRDWLPLDCPRVRVIAINYTTDPYLWRPFWMSNRLRTPMSERSWEMIHSLVDIGVGKHSIVWVGHSKGGLYVKQVLVHACETLEDKYKQLSRNTKGVIFYSVPHRGSPLANLNIPPLFRQSVELTEVRKNCDDVLTLHNKFINLLDTEQLKIDVKSFIETQQTLMSFIYVQIVSEESADAQVGEVYGVPLDHRNICKPKNRRCFLYRELVSLIKAICDDITKN